MIVQAVMDFIRDLQVNWMSGVNSLVASAGIDSAASAVGGAAAGAGKLLALFVGPASWPAVLSASGLYGLVFLSTALIAVVARRGTAS